MAGAPASLPPSGPPETETDSRVPLPHCPPNPAAAIAAATMPKRKKQNQQQPPPPPLQPPLSEREETGEEEDRGRLGKGPARAAQSRPGSGLRDAAGAGEGLACRHREVVSPHALIRPQNLSGKGGGGKTQGRECAATERQGPGARQGAGCDDWDNNLINLCLGRQRSLQPSQNIPWRGEGGECLQRETSSEVAVCVFSGLNYLVCCA